MPRFARFTLTRAVDGEHREAPLEQRIAVHRIIFFDAVHAGDVHDAGNFFAGFARREADARALALALPS